MSKSNDPLRVAISGCHRMTDPTPGSHNWASAFAVVPDTTVVGVFDYLAEAREQFRACWRDTWGDVPAFDDYDRMLAETRPDIVCVTTRTTMHADQIEAAGETGACGILTDRPIAPSLAEADRILDAVRNAGVPLAYGLERRWNARYRKLSAMLADGLIGDVTSVAMFGNGSLVFNGGQLYAPAMSLVGDPQPVWAAGVVDDVSEEPPDSRLRQDPPGHGWVGLSNGAHISISPEGTKAPAYTVVGTEGRLEVLNDTRQVYHWGLEDELGGLASEPRMIDLPEESEPWATGKAVVRDLVQAVRTGGKTALDVEEARRVTEIGFAIHASSAAGGARVEIPVVNRAIRVEGPPDGNEQP